MNCPDQKILNKIFPPERTDEFFAALYGDAEEGAYDIQLICRNVSENTANFAFELRRRPGQCLRCNLTYGLPQVFQRHPVINIKEIIKELGKELNWGEELKWSLGETIEESEEKHFIPLIISKT